MIAEGTQYRPMTVIARYYSQPAYKFKIDRSCYFPVPNVHGALTTFALRRPEERPKVRSTKEYLALVRKSFQAKRKLLSNALSPGWDKSAVQRALRQIGMSKQVWCRMHRAGFLCCYLCGSVLLNKVRRRKLKRLHRMQARPQELTPDQFAELYSALCSLEGAGEASELDSTSL